MLETSARLLRLLSLLQQQQDWSGPQLAERLGVTVRTVRRDVDRLRELGYPVHATIGNVGGYRLGAGTRMPPLLLDDEEAVAVAIGLSTAANGTVEGIEETSMRALSKLEQILPPRLRHRVSSLSAATVAANRPGAVVSAELMTTLAGACRDHQRLRIDYRSHDGTETIRLVEPHKLVHAGRRWYLVAFDVDRDDWRTFRVDRLRPWTPPGPRFTPRTPPDENIGAYASWAVGVQQYRYQGRFTMHAPADQVAARVPADTGLIEAIDENTCTLRSGSNSLDGLALHVTLLGFEFTVHEPPELVERFRTLHGRMGRAVES
ncbi:helix-turn-helix transcriptional regulator [Cryptosporangium aurantiacum]|uniref:Predicted DNA-binding transcriptional regulator YafY, contains an HTH and WYL domains n=1 Tax=Cryptosporangium aurantiacum TaxID=134849 RepID=A0A1M7RDI1_9ACTN|nr:YafY family protein [Cryptosporangium aurantiacum]SHN44284.1 Predicted DNA-binding transcriptional regulator YafY, contains an HTH and WYL domains [Cryptosporangium aurantiacum]